MSEDRLSKIGESFVFENFPLLFTLPILKCEMNTRIPGRDCTEGADLETWLLITRKQGEEWLGDHLKEVVGEGEAFSIEKIVKGPIEVKTSAFNQYLSRDDYGFNFDCGVISFAIWNSSNFEGREEPKRKRLGSLYRMFYPSVAAHERRPLAYVAVFVNMKEVPYACLIFEDFPALKDRLIEIGRNQGLDLTEEGFRNIPCLDNTNGWNSPDEWADMKMAENPELHLKQNMWYIRMSDVIDLATVVLIGEPPEIDRTVKPYMQKKQEQRWRFLQEQSRKTIPLITDEETKNEIQMRNASLKWLSQYSWKKDETTGNMEMRIIIRPNQQ